MISAISASVPPALTRRSCGHPAARDGRVEYEWKEWDTAVPLCPEHGATLSCHYSLLLALVLPHFHLSLSPLPIIHDDTTDQDTSNKVKQRAITEKKHADRQLSLSLSPRFGSGSQA